MQWESIFAVNVLARNVSWISAKQSMGFAKKLILKPDAMSCIYPGNPTGIKHLSVYFIGRSF